MEIRSTPIFSNWLDGLRDREARLRIAQRIDRLARGNPGETRSVGSGVFELKLNFGPGYRVYYRQVGSLVIVLLCGGDKGTQPKDIERAKLIAAEFD